MRITNTRRRLTNCTDLSMRRRIVVQRHAIARLSEHFSVAHDHRREWPATTGNGKPPSPWLPELDLLRYTARRLRTSQ